MKDNKGYSLIELVVVILILSIVVGVSIIGLGMINGKPADQCANSLDMSFASHRVSAMGKVYDESKTYLLVRRGADDCIYVTEMVEGAGNELKVCNKGVTFTYTRRNGTSGSLANPGDSLKFCFDRSTGALKLGADIQTINISKANREYSIELYNLTGKARLTKLR